MVLVSLAMARERSRIDDERFSPNFGENFLMYVLRMEYVQKNNARTTARCEVYSTLLYSK